MELKRPGGSAGRRLGIVFQLAADRYYTVAGRSHWQWRRQTGHCRLPRDGRPDYRYEARLLYADDIAPSRCSVKGGTVITISGIGFSSNMQVQVGTTPVTVTPVSATRMVFQVPALQDGTYSVSVRDNVTGASSVIENVLRVGAADVRLMLLGGSNPQVPVGTQAPNPFRVQVVDIYTGDPVAGATVNFIVPESASMVGCDLTLCTVITDQNGVASVYLLVKAAGASVIQASVPAGGNSKERSCSE